MKTTSSPQDEEIIELLKRLGTLKAEYPSDLLAARRAAFVAQIEERKLKGANEEYFSPEQVVELLEGLKPVKAEYPPELLTARRAAFITQIEQRSNGHVPEEASPQDQLTELFGKLKSAHPEYPPELLSARRAAFYCTDQTKQQWSCTGRIPVPGSGDPTFGEFEVSGY